MGAVRLAAPAGEGGKAQARRSRVAFAAIGNDLPGREDPLTGLCGSCFTSTIRGRIASTPYAWAPPIRVTLDGCHEEALQETVDRITAYRARTSGLSGRLACACATVWPLTSGPRRWNPCGSSAAACRWQHVEDPPSSAPVPDRKGYGFSRAPQRLLELLAGSPARVARVRVHCGAGEVATRHPRRPGEHLPWRVSRGADPRRDVQRGQR
jgi:hypothetical protein